MRLLVCVVLAGCGWGNEGDLIPIDAREPFTMTFDEVLPGFRTAYCAHAAVCEGADLTTCENHVTESMAKAKAFLSDEREAECAWCMWNRMRGANKTLDDDCRALTDDEQRDIFGACSRGGIDTNTAACAYYP